jgi:lysophospholipase L1-like esterase
MRLLSIFFLALSALAQDAFFLKPGDRVVFYGDSITDQRLYTTFVETYVRTRYPRLDVSFVHSGWGGDRVTGGGGGAIDVRLKRDVQAYKPTVVTIMLGMNDGRYRASGKAVFDWYATGYEAMVQQLKTLSPGVKIVAIRPSPFDDVTRPPTVNGGYNTVLIQFGDFIRQLAAREGMTVADLNAPVVRMLQKANAANPELAQRIIPDRVHPGAAGHLIMAGALLKDWGAANIVSIVAIDANSRTASTAANTAITAITATEGAGLAWKQTDNSLPMPVELNDAPTALAVQSGAFTETFNQQTLQVANLKAGHYALRIDGQQVKVFTDAELAAGLDLTALPTPMMKQAAAVHALTLKRTGIHNTRWRTIEVPMADDSLTKAQAAMDALDALDAELDSRQRAAAAPLPRHYELIPVPAEAATVPAGFTPIFNGKDLSGWHISTTNHHGTTPDWKVEGGILTGMQNPAGKGGILLTDRKYRNFEVYVELNPDWGCDGGLFLRSSEKGEAYQVLLDYREKGTLGGIYGERLKGVPTYDAPDWEKHWKKGEWNTIRARIEGGIPRIQVWMNGVRVTEWADTANHAAQGALDGMIAVQVHGGAQIWKEGGRHRFRNLAVRELN